MAAATATATSAYALELLLRFAPPPGEAGQPVTLVDVTRALTSAGQVVALARLGLNEPRSYLEQQSMLRSQYAVLRGQIEPLNVVYLSMQSPLELITELPVVFQAVGGVAGLAGLVKTIEYVFSVRPRIRHQNAKYNADAEEDLLRRDRAAAERQALRDRPRDQLRHQVEQRSLVVADAEIVIPDAEAV